MTKADLIRQRAVPDTENREETPIKGAGPFRMPLEVSLLEIMQEEHPFSRRCHGAFKGLPGQEIQQSLIAPFIQTRQFRKKRAIGVDRTVAMKPAGEAGIDIVRRHLVIVEFQGNFTKEIPELRHVGCGGRHGNSRRFPRIASAEKIHAGIMKRSWVKSI